MGQKEQGSKRYTHDEVFAKLRGQLKINAKYQLIYLTLFFDDVINATSYIKNELSNSEAANDSI